MEVMRFYLTVVVVFFCCPHLSESYCYGFGPPLVGEIKNCKYQNRVFKLSSKLIDYKKCEEYSCYADGSFYVCGIGINTGATPPPPRGCVIIRGEKCTSKMVYANDHTKPC